jgi:DNA-binding transcriptional MerR regulator
MWGLTVGDFSQMTYLSVTTLRHYHQVGLLEPAEANPDNGYRYYSQDQIPAVRVIRRLYPRSLGGCFRNRG